LREEETFKEILRLCATLSDILRQMLSTGQAQNAKQRSNHKQLNSVGVMGEKSQ
jgi:hypothetical protein